MTSPFDIRRTKIRQVVKHAPAILGARLKPLKGGFSRSPLACALRAPRRCPHRRRKSGQHHRIQGPKPRCRSAFPIAPALFRSKDRCGEYRFRRSPTFRAREGLQPGQHYVNCRFLRDEACEGVIGAVSVAGHIDVRVQRFVDATSLWRTLKCREFGAITVLLDAQQQLVAISEYASAICRLAAGGSEDQPQIGWLNPDALKNASRVNIANGQTGFSSHTRRLSPWLDNSAAKPESHQMLHASRQSAGYPVVPFYGR